MLDIPKTQKKLREAAFFFSKLHATRLDRGIETEEVEFYLSAFISAGRSVTFALQYEAKAPYDAWFPGWASALREVDRDLLRSMVEQRNATQKKGEIETEGAIEYIPVTSLERRPGRDPHLGFQWFGPVGTPPPSVGVTVYSFDVGGTKDDVVATCRRYLSILDRLVKDFIAAHAK